LQVYKVKIPKRKQKLISMSEGRLRYAVRYTDRPHPIPIYTSIFYRVRDRLYTLVRFVWLDSARWREPHLLYVHGLNQVWVVAGGDQDVYSVITHVCVVEEAANRLCESCRQREPGLGWIVEHLIIDA
jgi:hypothetical protein